MNGVAAAGGALTLGHDAFLKIYVNERLKHLGLPATAPDAVMHAFDLDGDNEIAWEEWAFWLTWTIRNFPEECVTVDDVHAATVRHAVTTLKVLINVRQGKRHARRSTLVRAMRPRLGSCRLGSCK